MGLKSILQCFRPDCNHRLLPCLWLSIPNLQDWLFSLKNQSQPFHHILGLKYLSPVFQYAGLSHHFHWAIYLTPEVPEDLRAQGAALLMEERVATWLCPQINCMCPPLSNMSHLGISLAGNFIDRCTSARHIPHTTNWPTDKPHGVGSQWCHPSLGHPEPPPHALFQTIPTGLPKLLQQKMQLCGNFSDGLTAAWSWQEGETSQVQLQLPTGPSAPRATSKLKYHFFSEVALTAISPTVWGNNSLPVQVTLSLRSIFGIPVETVHMHTIIAGSDDVFLWCGYLPLGEGIY